MLAADDVDDYLLTASAVELRAVELRSNGGGAPSRHTVLVNARARGVLPRVDLVAPGSLAPRLGHLGIASGAR